MTKEEKREARQQVKQELRHYMDLERENEQIREQIKKLELKMYAPGTSRMGDGPRGGRSSDVDAMTEAVQHKDNLERLYTQQLARNLEKQYYIEQRIEPLGTVERTLMRHRYIEGKRWEDVCAAMAYSWSHMHRIHAHALDKLAGIHEGAGTNAIKLH